MFISRKFGGAKLVVFGGLNSPLGGLSPSTPPLVLALTGSIVLARILAIEY